MRTRIDVRPLAILAVVAMLVAACSTAAPSPTAPPAQGQAATTAAPAVKQSQGVTKDTIKIGTSQPVTGRISQSGAELQAGLDTGVKTVNEMGGVNGRKLELISLDDAYEAPRQVANIRRLVEQDQVFLLNAVSGGALIPASYDFIKEKGIPVFGPNLPPDPKLPMLFIVGATRADQGRAIVDYFANEKKVKSIGLVYINDEVGLQMKKGLEDQIKKYPEVKVPVEVSVERDATDVSSVVLKAKDANPDLVILGTSTSQTVLVLKEAQKLGWKPMFAGDNGTIGGTGALSGAGSAIEGAYGTVISALPDSTTPEVEKFRQQLKKYYPDHKPSTFHLENYARTLLLAEILKKMGENLTWDNFIKTTESVKDLKTGLFPPMTFGPLPDGHTGSAGVKMCQVQNGKWVEVSDFYSPKN